ncbi:MAG: CBS domain-containing protein [Candidatus Bathyarchaeota archaeon]|nr:MAG: CBS domain-containing protein [Candidatus Bathyarchaeota archaeon]
MNVKEIMVEKVVIIRADATVKEAVRLMNEYEIGCLLVAENEETVGIITERDVLKRIISESKNPEMIKVSEIMSKPLIVGGPDMYIEDATRLMFKENIKKLPIMENEQLVGLVTLSDIARVAHLSPQIIKIINELKKKGWLPSRRMKKVIDFYIA